MESGAEVGGLARCGGVGLKSIFALFCARILKLSPRLLPKPRKPHSVAQDRDEDRRRPAVLVERHEDLALDSAGVGDQVGVVDALEDQKLLVRAPDSARADHLEHFGWLEPVVRVQLHHVEEESTLTLRALPEEVVHVGPTHRRGGLHGPGDVAEYEVCEEAAELRRGLEETVDLVLLDRLREDPELEVLLVSELRREVRQLGRHGGWSGIMCFRTYGKVG